MTIATKIQFYRNLILYEELLKKRDINKKGKEESVR